MTENNKPKLLGPDKLTVDQILALPKEKRGEYLRSMTAQEKGDFFTGGMVETLNAKQNER